MSVTDALHCVALGGNNACGARRRGDTHGMTCDGGSTTRPVPAACKWLQLIKFNQCHYDCCTFGDHLSVCSRPHIRLQ